jgi:hypothetical protein
VQVGAKLGDWQPCLSKTLDDDPLVNVPRLEVTPCYLWHSHMYSRESGETDAPASVALTPTRAISMRVAAGTTYVPPQA